MGILDMHVLVVYTSMFSYMFLAFPAIYHVPFVNKGLKDLTMGNDDIVATLCNIHVIIANAVKNNKKKIET